MNVPDCSFLCDNSGVKQGLSILISLYHMFTGKCIAKFGQIKMLRLLLQSKWAAILCTWLKCMYTWLIYVHTCMPFSQIQNINSFRSGTFNLHLFCVNSTYDMWLIVLLLILTIVMNTYVHMCTPVQDVKEQFYMLGTHAMCMCTYMYMYRYLPYNG